MSGLVTAKIDIIDFFFGWVYEFCIEGIVTIVYLLSS